MKNQINMTEGTIFPKLAIILWLLSGNKKELNRSIHTTMVLSVIAELTVCFSYHSKNLRLISPN